MAVTGISANRLELLQIAEAVAREKNIDREIVIEAIEEAIQKGAQVALRRPPRHPRQDRPQDRRTVADAPRHHRRRRLDAGRRAGRVQRQRHGAPARRPEARPRGRGRQGICRTTAPVRVRARPDPDGPPGRDRKGPRGRTRQPVRRVQGSRRRDRQRHGQARRIRQHHRRPGPGRRRHAPRPVHPARSVQHRRPHPHLHL